MLIATWLGKNGSNGNGSRSPSRSQLAATILEERLTLERPGIGIRVGRRHGDLFVGPLSSQAEHAEENRLRFLVRRNLNVAAAAVLLLITAPVMIAVALAIRLTSRGPILYTQPRVGIDRRDDDPHVPVDPRRQIDHGGRIFQIYKFRTMQPRPESENGQRWASQEEERITTVGRFLRRYRIDELPQLFNVLKGEMNLVGPRPEQPDIFKQMRDTIDGYERRQRVLPGITGLAQVNHHYDQCVEDVRRKVTLDLEYLERVSPLQDLRIMAQTVPVVLFGRGGM